MILISFLNNIKIIFFSKTASVSLIKKSLSALSLRLKLSFNIMSHVCSCLIWVTCIKFIGDLTINCHKYVTGIKKLIIICTEFISQNFCTTKCILVIIISLGFNKTVARTILAQIIFIANLFNGIYK